MATWRIIVTAPDAEKMDAFKNDLRFYKKLYNSGGAEATFEVPEAAEATADDIIAEAKKLGLEARKEKYEDPLESSGATADFW